MRNAGSLAVLCAVLTALALACGGDDKDEGFGSNAAASTTPPVTRAAPVATPMSSTRGATPPPAATTRASTPQPSPSSRSGAGSSARLADLSSFRFSVKMEGFGGPLTELEDVFGSSVATGGVTSIEISGAYVKPDRAVQNIKLGSLNVTQTTIGRQQWTALGTLLTGPETLPVVPPPSELALVVDLWDESLAESVAIFACSGRESVNGIQTRRCGLGEASFAQIKDILGTYGGEEFKTISEFQLEAWLAEQGDYPSRVRIRMAGRDTLDKEFRFTIAIDVTDVNSTSIRIDPPR